MAEEEIYSRYKDAPWFAETQEVTIGGVGGIGSWLTLLLSRMNYTLYIYDFDIIEIHNIGGQLYGRPSVGKPKTEAIRETCKIFSDNTKVFPQGKFTEKSMVTNIVFACFDNMEARKIIFDKWKNLQLSKTSEYRKDNPKEINIFIDGRMAAETGYIYGVNSIRDIERYESELFTDEEVPSEQCSFRATSHCGAFIASQMVALLTNQITNKLDIPTRDVPFKIEFELPLFTTNTIA